MTFRNRTRILIFLNDFFYGSGSLDGSKIIVFLFFLLCVKHRQINISSVFDDRSIQILQRRLIRFFVNQFPWSRSRHLPYLTLSLPCQSSLSLNWRQSFGFRINTLIFFHGFVKRKFHSKSLYAIQCLRINHVLNGFGSVHFGSQLFWPTLQRFVCNVQTKRLFYGYEIAIVSGPDLDAIPCCQKHSKFLFLCNRAQSEIGIKKFS